MHLYRFQSAKPGVTFAAVAVGTAVALGAPSVIHMALPDRPPAREEVALTGIGWDQPINGLTCSVNGFVESMDGWDCNRATLQVWPQEDVEDADLALRRMVRFMTYGQLPAASPVQAGRVSLLADPDSGVVALNLAAPAELDEPPAASYTLVVTGPKADVIGVVEKIWAGVEPGAGSGVESAALPEEFAQALDALPASTRRLEMHNEEVLSL